jgi:hypothetical protein
MTREVCNGCYRAEDLRYGACFSCADFVKTDGLTAWDVRNPMNHWMVNREPRRTATIYFADAEGRHEPNQGG